MKKFYKNYSYEIFSCYLDIQIIKNSKKFYYVKKYPTYNEMSLIFISRLTSI